VLDEKSTIRFSNELHTYHYLENRPDIKNEENPDKRDLDKENR